MLSVDGAAVGRSCRDVFMMNVKSVQNMWDSCFPALCPTPRSLLMKVIHMQTANRTNTAMKDKCISWNTKALHHSSEPIWLLNYQPFHCIHGSIQYLFEAVNTSRNSFFGVKVSLKDGCVLKNDDNRKPALCVLQVVLSSEN